MSWQEYCLLFAAMGLVTYLPRCLPLIYLAHRRLPKPLVDWLSLIPAAILSALIAPSLFTNSSTRSLELGKPELWVAIPTLYFAWKTKNLAGTVVLGMALYWLAGFV
ncbi:AzlD domain-containing protein [Desulfobulbus rhabdoformis]|uniref:AzlD domain-containing protein n=1 Tax=Desulfobulbus rhabdoformis TaxID=34032 RepID=UPI001966AE3F|nr:AzlD domain-containing protein [Desulfobulbus rhabdoformis]MBM9613332.1 AzlD domain-containing protein [Desulfobulbus rhabdoformis]